MYDTNSEGEQIASDMTTCYFCTATYSATIGGIGTLVGTATNLVFKGLFVKAYPEAPEYLSFPLFSAFSVPYMLVLNTAVYLCMSYKYFGLLRPNSAAARGAVISPEGIKAAKLAVDKDWNKIGKISFWEMMVIILFSTAIIMFFSRSPQIFVGWADLVLDYFNIPDKKFIKDSSTAMLICFLMFLLPSNLNFFTNFTAKFHEEFPSRITSVLDWNKLNAVMPYSFMFLLGGGFALSTAAKPEYSNLNGKIGEVLSNLRDLPNLIIILLVIIFTVLVTNFTSNVVVCNVVAPIVMQMGQEINRNPLWYNMAAGFSASYCFMLPVGTPGNLIVQSAANIPTIKMIKAGALPTAAAILLSWIFLCFWAPVVWPDLSVEKPDWVK